MGASNTTGGLRAAALVTQMAIVTLVLGYGGVKLDARFDTGPWLMVTGFLLGFATGMVALFIGLSRLRSPDDDEPSSDP